MEAIQSALAQAAADAGAVGALVAVCAVVIFGFKLMRRSIGAASGWSADAASLGLNELGSASIGIQEEMQLSREGWTSAEIARGSQGLRATD